MMHRLDVYHALCESRIVPVYYHADWDTARAAFEACAEGGCTVFEWTHRGPKADELFSQLLRHAATNFPKVVLGVGSIIDAPTAAMYLSRGANFIVSPLLNQALAKFCNRRKLAWIPGCGSLSEISQAEEWGAEIVKLFPAQHFGPEFLKSLLGPCPWSRVMPTGGIEASPRVVQAWLDAGACCVGLGSSLFKQVELQETVEKLLAES